MKHYEISRPLPSEVAEIYEGIDAERAGMAYAPESLAAIVEHWGTSMLLFSGRVSGDLAALFALCNPVFGAHGYLANAWVMVYIKPEYRGVDGLMLGRVGIDYARKTGAGYLLTACVSSNTAAQYFARRLGFARCEGPQDSIHDLIYYRLER